MENNNGDIIPFNLESVRNKMQNYVQKCYSNLNFTKKIFELNNDLSENNESLSKKNELFE